MWGGIGHSEIGERALRHRIDTCSLDTSITKQRQQYLDYVNKYGKDEESERLRAIANAIDDGKNTSFISQGIDNTILDEFVRVMKHINIYLWCNKFQLRQYFDYFGDRNCNFDLLTWHKTNPIPLTNNIYLNDTEYLFMAFEKGVGLNGSYDTKHKYYVSECNKADKDLYNHPTIKPLNFVKNQIINSSNENDIVLDAFAGSGTTLVACKELNRQYIGFELNEKWYKIAQDRLNGISQVEKKMIEEGQTTLF